MKISVIVATCNRSQAIIPCLDSIHQSLKAAAPLDAEIVVVDNASKDDTPEVLKKWAARSEFPVNLEYEKRKGAAVARNRGIRASRGDILVCTDDDCRLSENHIKDVIRHDSHDSGPVLRGGRVELGNPDDLPITIKTSRDSTRWSKHTHFAKNANYLDTKHGCNIIIGCNIAMRRTAAKRIGVFDERFGPGTRLPGADDTDFAYRAYLAGVTLEYVPDMVMFHFHGRKSKGDGYKLMKNYMISTGGLYAKYLFRHPNFCRHFYWDLRQAVQEVRAGKSSFMPEIGFSFKKKVAYNLLGAMRYYFG